jgi:tetratricopeptide (TPR) repeat protein
MPFRKNAPKGTQQPTDAKRIFIARTNELLFFIHHILEPEEPTYNIISISGQGGVGKSTLVNRLIDEAGATNFKDYCLTAKVDERQTIPASIMQRFADQLRDAGQPLKKFEEKLTSYKESLRRMYTGHKEEQEMLVRETIDIAGTVAEEIPIVGGLMHKGANTFTEILIEKGRTSQYLKDAAKLEDSIGDLTKAFIKDLNQITEAQVGIASYRTKRKHRVILFFDTFEQLASDVAPWLLDHFLEADISPNVVLVVAGRDSIENSTSDDPKRWLPYFDEPDIYLMTLNSFTEQETQALLEERGITDPVKISQMWHMSRGLPLYLGLLTCNPQGNVDPTADVVENFLRWIPKDENLKRRLALDAALFSLPFNQDDLAAFTYLEQEQSALYHWLIGQPFVRSNPQDGRHIYHDLAQEMFSRHLYQRSPSGCRATRQALANYYQQRIEKLQAEGGKEVYKSVEWLELTLASAQQLFLLPDEDSHRRAIEQILIADEYAREREEIIRVLRNLSQQRGSNQISPGVQSFIEQLLRSIEADLADHDQEVVVAVNSLLEKITHIPSFSTEALAYLYRRRGRAYRVLKEYERALADFSKALALVSNYANAYAGRGETYRLLKDYQRALTDFDSAIALDSSDLWSLARRGQTYHLLKDYQHAIEDYNRALELDPKYSWAYDNRGRA